MPPNPSGTSVLVADDESQLLRLMQRVLQRAGYEVVTASEGHGTVRAFGERRDDIGVVVLDAAMPPKGAAVVLEAILTMRGQVGVVLISGDALAPPLRALLAQHDGVFLHKPFAPSALLRAVEDSLAKEGG